MNYKKSLKISTLTQLVLFVLSFTSVVIVSRLLRPDEIGVFSVAVGLLGIAHIFREFGVGQYLVQLSVVGRQQFRAAFTVTLITSWVISIILFAASAPIAAIYRHDGVGEVLRLIGLSFFILPFGTPLLSMLKRDLEFKRLATISIVGSIVQFTVTVVTAMNGESYLSMAWGSLAMYVSKILILNFMRPGETFIWPTLVGLKEVIRFGSVSSGTSILTALGSAAPDLILGRTMGFAEVAFFSRGSSLQNMLVDKINEIVRGVHFPMFANDLRAGADPAGLYIKAINYLLAVTVPTLAVLSILADPLIPFVFGEQWKRSANLATILCLSSILATPYALYGLSLTAAGKVSVYMRAEILIQCSRVSVLMCSFWFSLEQVVGLLLISYVIEALSAQSALNRVFGLSYKSFIKGIWKAFALVPFTIVGPLLTVILLAQETSHEAIHQMMILLISGFMACVGWLLGVFVTGHPFKQEIMLRIRK